MKPLDKTFITLTLLISLFSSGKVNAQEYNYQQALPKSHTRQMALPDLQRKLLSTTDLGARVVNELLEYFATHKSQIPNQEYISVLIM